MLTGLQKYAGAALRRRGSISKLQVMNTALVAAQSGLAPDEALSDADFRGRLVESAVGAHLANAAASGECELFYWREDNREVDFVVKAGGKLVAIEVKSGRRRESLPGMAAFVDRFRTTRPILVGADGIPLEDFLARPASDWIRA